jgi:hypothetical protein
MDGGGHEVEEEAPMMYPFNYQRMPRHGFTVVLHDSPERAADCISKLLKRHRFHAGDLFTHDAARHRFMYPCADAALLSTVLPDIARRQCLHMSMLPRVPPGAHEQLAQFDDETRRWVLEQLQPVHFLPRRLFGDRLPDDVFALINHFLIVPDAYLVLHHCVPSTGALGAKSPLRVALTTDRLHGLTRIVSGAHALALSPSLWRACDYLLVFGDPGKPAATNLFRRARLARIMRSPQVLQQLLAQQPPRYGLVLDVREDHASGNAGRWTDFDPDRVFWTTDIVRDRQGGGAPPCDPPPG